MCRRNGLAYTTAAYNAVDCASSRTDSRRESNHLSESAGTAPTLCGRRGGFPHWVHRGSARLYRRDHFVVLTSAHAVVLGDDHVPQEFAGFPTARARMPNDRLHRRPFLVVFVERQVPLTPVSEALRHLLLTQV